MMLLFFMGIMLIVGLGLFICADSLEERANQISCYDVRSVKGAVRGEIGLFVSESMLSYRRNKVNRRNSKF